MQEKTDRVNLLHSRYIRRDRAYLEDQIMKFSGSEETGIWITTQIVEASLDIDFDVLLLKCVQRIVFYRGWDAAIEREDIFRKKQMLLYMITGMELGKKYL